MKRQIFSLFLLLLTLVACGDKPLDPNKPVYVKIKTTMGDNTLEWALLKPSDSSCYTRLIASLLY